MKLRFRLLTYSAILALALTVTAGCSSNRQNTQTQAATLPFKIERITPKVLSSEEQLKFNTLYLEAIRQGLKGNDASCFELLNRALELNPDAAECLSRKAQFVTDSAETIKLLWRAIAVAPENAYYRKQLAYTYLNQEKYDSATIVLNSVVDLEEYPIDDLWLLYRLQTQQTDYDGALKTLERLERLEGDNEQFAYERIKLYLQAKRIDDAYEEAERLCRENPNEPRYQLLLASLYLDNGRASEGYAICRNIQAKEPENELAQTWLLGYYQNQGDTTAFHALLDSVISNPKISNPIRLQLLGSYIGEVRNDTNPLTVERVMNLFHKALRLPQDDSSLAELCEQYMVLRGLPSDSIIEIQYKNLEITPDNSAARTRLLLRLIRKEDKEAIIRLCKEGELYNPTHLHYYLYEGSALAQDDHNEEAIAVLRKGAEQYDGNSQRELASDLYALLGDLLHTSGKKSEAYAAYDSSLVYNPENMGALNNYAYFLSLDNAQLDKAEEMSYKTIQTEATNPTYLDTYAWILFIKGRYEQARLYIDETLKYIDETSENASVIDHAGDIYWQCGEHKEAIDFWKRALQLTAETAERQKIEAKLKKHHTE